jgi:ABC-type phosphate transport system permease subunit
VTGMALVANLMVLLTETESSSESGGGLSPYVVGAIALGILLAALLTVLAIGGGRDHS